MKNVWITVLEKDEAHAAALDATLRRYGLRSHGHFWIDEPDKAVARAVLDAMLEAKADAWVIVADAGSIARPGVRYGLSLVRASLASMPGSAPPCVCLWTDKTPALDAANRLPPLLRDALTFTADDAAWPAKLIAAAARRRAGHTQPPTAATSGYRLTAWGDEHIGQWLEIGAIGQTLAGFAFGLPAGETAAPAAIDFQAVGPRGALPEKTVLEYAQQGLEIRAGERTFSAWTVRNTIGPDDSYFVRITGCPDTILCMPYPDLDDGEATLIALR